MTHRLVVVGASLAGLRAVEGARKAGFTGQITLVGAEEHLPYDRPPLSKGFLEATGSEPQSPTYRTEQTLVEELGVEMMLGAAADGLDLSGRTVHVNGRGVPYDGLVIATGSAARPLPGVGDLAGVHTLRTLDDARAIRKGLDDGARTVVIGAGFIGSEVASAARKRGLEVAIVEALPTPLVRAIGDAMGEACSALHRTNGTDLRCATRVVAIEGDRHVERVRLSDGSVLETDLVVVGAGAEPATAWLADSGMPLDDGVVCDSTLAAGAPGVFAAGDVVRWFNPLFGRSMRLEHWTSAAEQGAAAGIAAAFPGTAKPYSTVPYFWSDWYDTRIQFVGIPAAGGGPPANGGVAGGGEVQVVLGTVESNRFVALYRHDDRLVGALALNRPRDIMKFRALIAQNTNWSDALAFAERRRP